MNRLKIKAKDKKLIKFLVRFLMIIAIGLAIMAFADWGANSLKESNKEAAITIEQSRENVKMAEKTIEKELNTSSKYFQIINRSGNYFLFGTYLNSNTESYWIDKALEAEVQLNGECYMVSFETKRVDSKNEEIEMYEPVKIIKLIKQ
ncbi:hypothetical protein BK744_09330 [Bacillus thuringiensis serovar zhaodongensis]|uniref:hypothetical protein n=1 Tax=Bacillus thuringiensis TaxID=1428 RepID=UPI000A36C378|nr:hypothetical protein [Bacillus thuringiensis]OUB77066.1 hypothetical protein BK744_09330 [Bacillus thuringiensis serovar zhaodongensis]